MRGFALTSLIIAAAMLSGAPAPGSGPRQSDWVTTWSAAQMAIDRNDELPHEALNDLTLRQLVRTTLGGSRIRIRFSNVFGREPLVIMNANIAKATSSDSSGIVVPTSRAVSFQGEPSVTIPAGAEFQSDPIALPIEPLTTIAISIHFHSLPNVETGHPGSRATSYVVAGDQVSTPNFGSGKNVDHWYFISAIDVEHRPTSAIAVLGDSITDGHGIPSNSDMRWTDYLAQRISKSLLLAVLNLGIGGNRLLEDGLGPNAIARFDRDILARDGVRYLIILEGVNDLGTLTRDAPASPNQHRALVQHMIAGYAQLIARAHNRGIKVIGATIMPDGTSNYYHPDQSNETDRAAVNAWIRTPGNFDAFVDFDALMRDPSHPESLRKELDSGDGLHPSPKGYRVMGEAVPLSLFSRK